MPDERETKRKSLQEMRADTMAGQSAWSCPQCHSNSWRVTNTWYSHGNKKRLRKCRNCGTPVNSCEVILPDGYSLQVVDKT
ncbi:MAG TPA: hypothetical protein VM260_22870 [Pirellula sp.]|nr:hypothetical protein [Pirellula sp.]